MLAHRNYEPRKVTMRQLEKRNVFALLCAMRANT